MKMYGVSGIAQPFQMEVSHQPHALTLYTWGKSPWYPLYRRLRGPQSWSKCCEEEKNLLSILGIEPELIIP
jgi:hypothetical protein